MLGSTVNVIGRVSVIVWDDNINSVVTIHDSRSIVSIDAIMSVINAYDATTDSVNRNIASGITGIRNK